MVARYSLPVIDTAVDPLRLLIRLIADPLRVSNATDEILVGARLMLDGQPRLWDW